jgi:acetoin utilization deacetylase AcuC-like enzyme
MHAERNFPFHKESSHLDIGLPDGCGDADYLAALCRHLPPVLDQAQPDLVCYLAGADPYGEDRFGRLRLSLEGLLCRDRMVFEGCRRRAIPVMVTLAGGYARELRDIVTIHLHTLQALGEALG